MIPFHLGEQTGLLKNIKGIKTFYFPALSFLSTTFLTLFNIQKLILGVEEMENEEESRFMIIYVAPFLNIPTFVIRPSTDANRTQFLWNLKSTAERWRTVCGVRAGAV